MISVEDIRRAASEINALHARINETSTLRHHDGVYRRQWEEACKAFHAYTHPIYQLWSPETLRSIREGLEPWRPVALLFLETDPWFFRSGYLKQKVLRALKAATLEPEEVERVNGILLTAVDSRDRREFKEYCRLAARVATSRLRESLAARQASSDERTRARATQMLGYVEKHGRPNHKIQRTSRG
jgi:hypothetical protein